MERLGRRDELIAERFDRHIRLPEIGLTGQNALLDARVLVVGVGGLGSPISLYLTAAGVGNIGIIDPDVVSLSNLQRQVLYTEGDVGLSKVDCASKRLKQLNSSLNIDVYPCALTKENALDIISRYDIVVDGCDNYATRYIIDDACKELEKPYVYGSIGAFNGQISVFNYKGGSSYSDLFPKEDAEVNDKAVMAGVMGVVPGTVGTLQASEVVKIITGCGEVLSNRLLLINLLTLNQQIIAF